MGFTRDLHGICYGGRREEGNCILGNWKFSQNLIEAYIYFEDGLGMVFTFFLKDNVHNVIATENNGIIVTRVFFRIFQAYRIRWISLE